MKMRRLHHARRFLRDSGRHQPFQFVPVLIVRQPFTFNNAIRIAVQRDMIVKSILYLALLVQHIHAYRITRLRYTRILIVDRHFRARRFTGDVKTIPRP